MRRLLIVAALLASVVTPAVRASAQTTGAVDAITWQSAGDSFSSGTGIPGAAGPCQHSTDAYGPVAARIVRDSGWQINSETFTACHGHLVEDFFNGRGSGGGSLWDWGREQGGPERVDVLTMSFGGNDIGFAHVMRDCAQVPDSWLDVTLGATGCDVSEDELKARIDALLDPPRDCTGTRVEQTDSYDCDLDIGSRRGSIIDFYYDIAQDRLTERGHLYVIGYPQIFAPYDEWRWYQKARCAAVSRGDTEKLASVALHLDYKLQEAVDRANKVLGDRIKYLNLRRLYRAGQHELCGSNDDWLNGIVIDGVSVDLEGFPSVSVDSEASFHPNAGGHQHTADLLARRVLQDLNNRPPPPTTTTTVATLVTAVPASATVPLPPATTPPATTPPATTPPTTTPTTTQPPDDRALRISWGSDASSRSDCPNDETCWNLRYEYIGTWEQPPYTLECWSNGQQIWIGQWTGKETTGCYYWGTETAQVVIDGIRSNELTTPPTTTTTTTQPPTTTPPGYPLVQPQKG